MISQHEYEELLSRIAALEEKVASLQTNTQPDVERKTSVTETVVEPIQETVTESISEPIHETVTETASEPIQETIRETVSEPTRESVFEEKKDNIESRVGKNLMSIMASILMFISLGIFGSFVEPILTDGMKAILMFVVSFIIAGIGLYRMDRGSRYDNFFKALAACGVGAVFVSSLVSHFALEVITEIHLITILGAWILGVMALAKYKSSIFTYICYAGVIISTFLSVFRWSASELGFFVYLIGVGGLFAINFSRDFSKIRLFALQFPIVLLLLCRGYIHNDVALTSIFVLNVVYIIALAHFYVIENEHKSSLNVISFFVAVALAVSQKSLPLAFEVVAPLLALLSVLLSRNLRQTAYLYLAINVITGLPEEEFWSKFLVLLACIIVLVIGVIRDYSSNGKYILTLIVALAIYAFRYQIDTSAAFLLCSAICLLINTKWYYLNPINKQLESTAIRIGYGANIIALIVGMSLLAHYEGSICFVRYFDGTETLALILITLMVLALSLINMRRLYTSLDEQMASMLNCLKFTVLAAVVLNRMTDVSYVISIVGLLLAVVFIVLGFRLSLKGCRLYGLVLSMLCVIKLVLSDIRYESSLMLAVGFFAGAVICYLISWIYTRLEKKL